MTPRAVLLFVLVAALIASTGFTDSWNVTLGIVNMGLVSAIMALGVNLQWGYAGLFNVGVVGFVALGGLGAVLVSMPPVAEAWQAGGLRILAGLALGAATIAVAVLAQRRLAAGWRRAAVLLAILVGGFFLFRAVFDPGVAAVESVSPASTGYLGGLGLPILLSWPAGGLLAAGAAWLVGKTALGLRSDYLAIATLGIAEIIIAVMKNEDWLARGVKNVIGLPRPVPYEIALQRDPDFVARVGAFGLDPVTASSLAVKLGYAGLFTVVLLILLWLTQAALASPWGRMMRAIRDNEVAAEAMGKDVTRRHLQVFVLGSAICGLAGAMMTTLDGQLVPGSYQPLALHLPDLGDGDRRRLGQQFRRDPRRLPDLVFVGDGRALRAVPDRRDHRGDAGRKLAQGASARIGGAYAADDDGADPAGGAAVQPARPDPRALAQLAPLVHRAGVKPQCHQDHRPADQQRRPRRSERIERRPRLEHQKPDRRRHRGQRRDREHHRRVVAIAEQQERADQPGPDRDRPGEFEPVGQALHVADGIGAEQRQPGVDPVLRQDIVRRRGEGDETGNKRDEADVPGTMHVGGSSGSCRSAATMPAWPAKVES